MINGGLIKHKLIFSSILENLNYFFYYNYDFFQKNYQNLLWVIDNFLEKNFNSNYIFNLILNLIKPPFLLKSILIPKKLRKKSKQKYLIKIVYRDESKRLKNAFKQLYYYSNSFLENKFKIRLYKAIMFSILDWKNSHLFKLKSMVFKKFFRF